jgi:formylglycine-generating enzyme required for sulfatase activity
MRDPTDLGDPAGPGGPSRNLGPEPGLAPRGPNPRQAGDAVAEARGSQASDETSGPTLGRDETLAVGLTPYAGTCPPRARRGGRVKILFLSANALAERPLRIDEELRALEQTLRGSRYRQGFEIVARSAVRLDDLQQLLLEHAPDIVHFAGHGDAETDLVLLDENGKPVRVSTEVLGGLFRALGADTSLVVFNACFSAEQADAARESVGLAVGMAGEITDRSARFFASAFYQALFYGCSVLEAFDLGVVAIQGVEPAQRHVPQLAARRGINPAQIAFVTRPSSRWRGELVALALALGAVGATGGLVSALKALRVAPDLSPSPQPGVARTIASVEAASPGPGLLAPRESANAPLRGANGAAPPARDMVFIAGAHVTIGAFDEATRPAECKTLGPDEDCTAATHPERSRTVEVRGFHLDTTEVTNEAFARWLDQHPDDWQPGTGSSEFVLSNDTPPLRLAWASDDCDSGVLIAKNGRARARVGVERRPVVCVTWQGATHYCRAQGKRLPTDAEWELAAKGPRAAPFPWGAEPPHPEGVAFGGRTVSMTGPREVASSAQDRSPEGVFDLGGNVAEWVDGGDGYARPLRGGSWWSTNPCHLLGSGCAFKREPTHGKDVGFRCARDVPTVGKHE